jgi:glycosyltransferase involved in cell wall biosynthesis
VKLSVLIPTHDPQYDLLGRVLTALRAQTLPAADWELILIDNASATPPPAELITWHPLGKVISAPTLGLTHARIAGCVNAASPVLIWVDDDNILQPDYLEIVLDRFAVCPNLGAMGGKSLPLFDTTPPAWYRPGLAPLGCRDLGDLPLEVAWVAGTARFYPDCAPIGAGLAIRREAMLGWADRVLIDPVRAAFGRTGNRLTSGEDNDINLTLLASGWSLAYEPRLILSHVIQAKRLTLDYQRRIARAAYCDFVRILAIHGIVPWPAVSPMGAILRRIRAWFSHRAWSGPGASIRWQASCGQIDGRVAIPRLLSRQ